MKKFKLTNKGMSIESAVVFMIVIFMFCAVIVSFSLYFNYQVKADKTYIERKAELDQIGEDFIRYMKTKQNSETTSESSSETTLETNSNPTSESTAESNSGNNSDSTFSFPNSKYEDKYTIIYNQETAPNTLEVYYKTDTNKSNILLYIKLDNDNKVIKWCYSDPKQGE